jgi:hypothetical protein
MEHESLSVGDIAFYIIQRCTQVVDPEGKLDFVFDVTRRLVDETAVALARKLRTYPLWVEDLLAAIGMIRSSGFEGRMEKEAIERVKNEGLDKLIDETIEEVKKEVCAKTKILVRILDNVNGYSSGDAIVVSLPEALALKENGQAKTLRVLK